MARVDSYSECLFTMYSIYIYIFIEKVFLLRRLLSTQQRFGIPAASLLPQQLDRVLSRCRVYSVMSALYGLKPKDE